MELLGAIIVTTIGVSALLAKKLESALAAYLLGIIIGISIDGLLIYARYVFGPRMSENVTWAHLYLLLSLPLWAIPLSIVTTYVVRINR